VTCITLRPGDHPRSETSRARTLAGMNKLLDTPYMRLAIGTFTLIAAIFVAAHTNGDRTIIGVLIGSGIVLWSDGWSDAVAHRPKARQDLDETRRTLYMALSVAGGSYQGSADLAGTVANALAHHSKKLSTEQAESLATRIVSASSADDQQMAEIRSLIAEITKQLGDPRSK
jgi:hypothetical protein